MLSCSHAGYFYAHNNTLGTVNMYTRNWYSIVEAYFYKRGDMPTHHTASTRLTDHSFWWQHYWGCWWWHGSIWPLLFENQQTLPPNKGVKSRKLRGTDVDKFSRQIDESDFGNPDAFDSVAELVVTYNSVLAQLLDKYAPRKPALLHFTLSLHGMMLILGYSVPLWHVKLAPCRL